jgi:putative flippase GtrA
MRSMLIKHREMVKFAIVGGTTFILTNIIWFGLKLTILSSKPITAQAIGILIATIVNYLLSREWSFRTRGGRETHHEASLFFVISAISFLINLAPTWVSRYVFDLKVPFVSVFTQELSDFFFGSIIGTLIAMVFRYWAMKKFVFPHEDVRERKAGKVRALRPENQIHVPEEDEEVA